jgi:hypothetical protein
MGLLRRLFGGGGDGAAHAEDCVWLDAAARERGLVRAAVARAGEGRSVLVVARSPDALERLAAALAPQAPRRCADRFERDALRAHLRHSGAVAVALPGALPPDAASPAIMPIETIICGRGERRSEDEPIQDAYVTRAIASAQRKAAGG